MKATRTDDGERHFNLKTDLAALEAKIVEVGEVLLVGIDPVSSYMGETDAHRNTSVRAVLDPVSDMADRVGVSVVTITHFRKEAGGQTTKKALHRFLDSIAFVAGPRACFAVIEDAEEPRRRLFLAVKHSLTALPVGLAFQLREKTVASDITTTHVVWDEQPVETTADQALAEASRSAVRSETRESILQALEDAPDGGTKPNEIAADLGIKPEIVRQRLLHMVRDGSVAKDSGGNYHHPSRVPPMPDLQSKAGKAKRTNN